MINPMWNHSIQTCQTEAVVFFILKTRFSRLLAPTTPSQNLHLRAEWGRLRSDCAFGGRLVSIGGRAGKMGNHSHHHVPRVLHQQRLRVGETRKLLFLVFGTAGT
mmetsp:Transcript_18066/g.37624  ORF Transcript_18066/g.37624 Transcript_18066/m.37624 type:complete len:105 (+) Transcript_18066:1481-1795(+)